MFFYSKVWFCLATQEGNPSILVFDVITLDAEGGGIGVGECEGDKYHYYDEIILVHIRF